ncbi:hypothetical protein BDY21DRAFT_366627 [Lineolata rhizophorae]|uniref:1-acyl-sn-glycerol-3-phosphate acyltransferase n=1 Tax=Lineolata rhizophorae TaxID=578093 RepID=A0A6A6NQ57_9PEZI|nr:hypothetical protein BDY21DRAFT_366627 [Lineolata rhizophorae]
MLRALLWTLTPFAFLSLLCALLYALAALAGSRLLGFAARGLASALALTACACYGVVASVVLRVLGYGGLGQWTTARAYKWTMRWVAGVEFVVEDEGKRAWEEREDRRRRGRSGEGEEKVGGRLDGAAEGEEVVYGRRGYLGTRPAVFVGNHQTELDVLLLACIFPPYCSVTSKKSLKYWPFLGWFMTASKTVFIDRANRTSAVAAFDGAAEQMRRERQSVFIFPEGTRSYAETPMLLPFKKGAFHLAVQAQVPVVPVVAANYSHILNMKKRVFNPGGIRTKVLRPIPTTGMTAADVPALAERVRDLMLRELVALSAHPEPNGAASKKEEKGEEEEGEDDSVGGGGALPPPPPQQQQPR